MKVAKSEGVRRVRPSFNPSGNDLVDRIKLEATGAIDLLDQVRAKATVIHGANDEIDRVPGYVEGCDDATLEEIHRLQRRASDSLVEAETSIIRAMDAFELAAMFAVKAATVE